VESVRPLRADQVGSLLRPPTLLEARAAQQAGRLSESDLSRLEITSLALIFGERKVAGSLTGNPATGNASFQRVQWRGGNDRDRPVGSSGGAYAKMMAGRARFRMVLVTNNGAGQSAPRHS
jgi:hypothetical protein